MLIVVLYIIIIIIIILILIIIEFCATGAGPRGSRRRPPRGLIQ